MKLPRWVRFLLWLCGADPAELREPGVVFPPALPPPSPELVARAAAALERARLEHQLRNLDGVLGVALGGAYRDPFTGQYIAKVDRRWLS